MFKRLSRSKCVNLSYLSYLEVLHSKRNWFNFTLYSQTFYANAIFYLQIPISASLNLSKTILDIALCFVFVIEMPINQPLVGKNCLFVYFNANLWFVVLKQSFFAINCLS